MSVGHICALSVFRCNTDAEPEGGMNLILMWFT